MVPDSHLVYADALPAGTTPTPHTPYRQVHARIDDATRAQCLYLLDDLVAGREEHDTFQTTDSHWTDFGAYLAYRRTMEVLRAQMPNIEVLPWERLAWSERLSFGALGAVMPEERSERIRVAEVVDSRCRSIRAISTEVRDGYLLVEQDRPDLPTAVIFRDSFKRHPLKFFSESFRRVAYVSHPNQLYFDLIEAEDPDVVIFETVERRLCIPPRDESTTDFRAVFGDPLLDDPAAIRAQVVSRSLLAQRRRRGCPEGQRRRAGSRTTQRTPDAVPVRAACPPRKRRGRTGRDAICLHVRSARRARRPRARPGPAPSGPARRSSRCRTVGHRDRARSRRFWTFAISTALDGGDAATACALARQALKRHSDESVLRDQNSQALVGVGDLEAGESSIRDALAMQPDDAVYLRQLASVLIRSEQWSGAEDGRARLRALEPDATDLAAFVDLVEQRLAGGGRAVAP